MKHKIALIITLIMMLLFSCTEPSLQEKPTVPDTPDNPVTPEVELSIQTQINDTISKLGLVSRVYSNSSAITPATASRALVSSKTPKESVTVDGKPLDRYSILVEYDTVTGEIADHLNKLTSADDGSNPRKSFDFSTIGGKVYVEYRFHFFAGTKDLAFMEVRMYDNLAIDTSFKVTEFSKDFVYDIVNQVRMKDGAKVGFNWETQEEKDADRFVLTTDSRIPPFATGLNNTWVMVDDDDEIVTHSNSAGMYLQEITLTDDLITLFRTPSLRAYTLNDKPEIDGYHGDFNQNYAYILIKKYPAGFRSAYSIWAYWFENGSWNASEHAFADESYRIKNWRPVTEEQILSEVKGTVSFMGTPTLVYQQYIGEDKVTQIWNSQIKGAYIIEFSSFKNGAKIAATKFNPAGREDESTFRNSQAGPLASDTVATVELLMYQNGYQRVMIRYKNGDKVYDTQRWLNIGKNTINGMDVDNPVVGDEWISLKGSTEHYDLLEKHAYPVPVFGNPNKIWQLRDEDGKDVTAQHTAGFYIYELPMTFQAKAFLEEYQDGDTDDKDLILRGFGYEQAKKDCFYANVMPTPPDHRTPCFIDFAWWNGEGWQHTVGMQADEQMQMMIWKKIDSSDRAFGTLYESIEKNIGEIESVKQLYAGDQPRLTVWDEPVIGDYILELESFNPHLRKAIKNPMSKKLFSNYYDESGKLDDDTVCTMHILYYNDNRIDAAIMIYGEDEDGSWDNSYAFLSCSKDFSVINGIRMLDGKAPDEWMPAHQSTKGHYKEITDLYKPGFYNPDRVWELQDGNGNIFTGYGQISSHIIEVSKDQISIDPLKPYEERTYDLLYSNNNKYLNADTNAVYVEINHYNDITPYWIIYNWYENDRWHKTTEIKYTKEKKPILYRNETDSNDAAIMEIKGYINNVGTINRIFQAEVEGKPYQNRYVVELNSTNKNLLAAISYENNKLRTDLNITTSPAGRLMTDTSCLMELQKRFDGNYYSLFLIKNEKGLWTTSYSYMNCSMDFSVINGVDMNTGKPINK